MLIGNVSEVQEERLAEPRTRRPVWTDVGGADRDMRLRDGSLEDSEPEPETAAHLGKRHPSSIWTSKKETSIDWRQQETTGMEKCSQ